MPVRSPASRVAPPLDASEFSNSRRVVTVPSGFFTSITQWPWTVMPSWFPPAFRSPGAAGCSADGEFAGTAAGAAGVAAFLAG